MQITISFDPDTTAIAEAVGLLEQVRDLLASFLEMAQAQSTQEIKSLVLETMMDVYDAQRGESSIAEHARVASTFTEEWWEFCANYQIPIRTQRAVERSMRQKGLSGFTLHDFLDAGREYWIQLRNVGEKTCNDIEQAQERHRHRYSGS